MSIWAASSRSMWYLQRLLSPVLCLLFPFDGGVLLCAPNCTV